MSFPYKRLVSEITKNLNSLQKGVSRLEENWVEKRTPSLRPQVTSILKKETDLISRDVGYILQRIERVAESLKESKTK